MHCFPGVSYSHSFDRCDWILYIQFDEVGNSRKTSILWRLAVKLRQCDHTSRKDKT